jgi:hypothetical protein
MAIPMASVPHPFRGFAKRVGKQKLRYIYPGTGLADISVLIGFLNECLGGDALIESATPNHWSETR